MPCPAMHEALARGRRRTHGSSHVACHPLMRGDLARQAASPASIPAQMAIPTDVAPPATGLASIPMPLPAAGQRSHDTPVHLPPVNDTARCGTGHPQHGASSLSSQFQRRARTRSGDHRRR